MRYISVTEIGDQVKLVKGRIASRSLNSTYCPEESLRASVARSRTAVITASRVLLAKFGPTRCRFVTLTYRDNQDDIYAVKRHLTAFMRKLARRSSVASVMVFERQERGAWHVHMLLGAYKLKSAHILHKEAWPYGYVHVQKVRGEIDKLVAYLTKYLSKTFDEVLPRAHRYRLYGDLKPKKTLYRGTDAIHFIAPDDWRIVSRSFGSYLILYYLFSMFPNRCVIRKL